MKKHGCALGLLATLVLLETAPTVRAEDEVRRVQGLEEPVEILIDRWGIAHIYASTESDLFFAQGYNAARDRLFQLEIWRRQATGTMAEILGRKELERDIGTRLHLFRGDLKRSSSTIIHAAKPSWALSYEVSMPMSRRRSNIPTCFPWSSSCWASNRGSGRRRSSSLGTRGCSRTSPWSFATGRPWRCWERKRSGSLPGFVPAIRFSSSTRRSTVRF